MTKYLIPFLFAGLAWAQGQPPDRIVSGTDAGSTDAYAFCPTASGNPTVSAYYTGMKIRFVAATVNTGPASINVCTLGAKTIKKPTGGVTTDLEDNDIQPNQVVECSVDAAGNCQMTSARGNYGSQPLIWTLDGNLSVLTSFTGPTRYVKTACKIPLILVDAGDWSGSLTVVIETATQTTGTKTWTTLATVSVSSATGATDTTGYTVAGGKLVRPRITGTPTTIQAATVDARCN